MNQITLADIASKATETNQWIDDAFDVVVQNVVVGQGTGKTGKAKPTKCDVIDPQSGHVARLASFGGRNMASFQGHALRLSGKGISAKLYSGVLELTLGKDSNVEDLGIPAGGGTGTKTPAPQPQGPRDDSRGSSGAGGGTGAPPLPQQANYTPAELEARFHKDMKKTALLLLHSFQYATDLRHKIMVDLKPEQFEKLVMSFFMTSKDRGWMNNPIPAARIWEDDGKGSFIVRPFAPKVDEDSKRRAEEEQKRKADEAARLAREEEERRHAAQNLDEDVPF